MSRTTTPETQAIYDFLDKHGSLTFKQAQEKKDMPSVERVKFDVTAHTWRKRKGLAKQNKVVVKQAPAKRVGRPAKAQPAVAKRAGRPRAVAAPAVTSGFDVAMAWVQSQGNVARAKAFVAQCNEYIAQVEAAAKQLKAVA